LLQVNCSESSLTESVFLNNKLRNTEKSFSSELLQHNKVIFNGLMPYRFEAVLETTLSKIFKSEILL
jgi:hypothetical protein